MTQTSLVRAAYSSVELVQWAKHLLVAAGLDPQMSLVVAQTLVEGDLLGHDTHGLALLPGYLKDVEAGGMTREGDYRVVSAKPAAQLWDGMRLPGPWLIERGLDVLIPAAREMGVASLTIKRSHHIACLAVYLMRAAREGLLMVLASSDPNVASVAPYGGTRAVFTPNPIAMGFPCSRGDVLIDISASITTNGMSNRKAAAGEKFAEEWLLDAQGLPTNDPGVFNQKPPGTILPLGGLSYGHKGFGLGLMLALLAGLLQFASFKAVIMVAVVFGAGQLIESFWLTPKLVGERIGLHPLAVIFALLALGQLFGFVGVLVALPVSAVLLVAIRRARDHYFSSDLYQGFSE
jgi:LDH2 family malate/lactate/ureidoglycolate dehydrogenase